MGNHVTAAERRWIVLDNLGRHVTIGRHSDPTAAELNAAAEALAGLGRGGWLAVMEGAYYAPGSVKLLEVSVLTPCAETFESAAALFQCRRGASN